MKKSPSPRIRSLANAVRKLDAVFCCGGTVTLADPARLRFRDGTSLALTDRDGWRSTDVGRKLMKRCEPAPFGAGRETRRDARVRSGGQLRAERGAFRLDGFDLGRSGILGKVARSLCPDQIPHAELYALNVYPRGGHFVTHKDTPRDGDVFGTLVACFPIPFRGGRLRLRHDETSRSFDWEIDRYRVSDLYEVQWAAFYGDVDHSIDPVTDGTRVTVTWLLRASAAIRREGHEGGETRLERAFASALAEPSFMPKGGTLGVPCLHLYPHARGDTPDPMPALKGRDRLVAIAAERAGLAPRCAPYLFETCAYQSWMLARYPTKKEAAIFRDARLEEYELEETMPIERRIEWKDDDVEWIVPPPWIGSWERRQLGPSDDPDAATELLGDLEYSATGYFGNEAGDAAFYTSAAILLDVPRASSPSRRSRKS